MSLGNLSSSSEHGWPKCVPLSDKGFNDILNFIIESDLYRDTNLTTQSIEGPTPSKGELTHGN